MYCVIFERDLEKPHCLVTLFKTHEAAIERAEEEASEEEQGLNVYVCELVPRSRSYRTAATEAL